MTQHPVAPVCGRAQRYVRVHDRAPLRLALSYQRPSLVAYFDAASRLTVDKLLVGHISGQCLGDGAARLQVILEAMHM